MLVWLQSRFREAVMMAQRSCPLPALGGSEDRQREVATRLKEFIGENGIDSPEIYLALPTETGIVRDLQFPLAVKENFRETIRLEMEKYIPLPVDQIYYDWQIIAEDKKNKQLTILLVVIRKEDLDPWLRMCREFELGISGIELTATALANGLAGMIGKPAREAAVYFHPGSDRTTLCLLSGGQLLAARTVVETTLSLPELLAPELKIAREHGVLAGKPLGIMIGSEAVRFGSEIPGSSEIGPVVPLADSLGAVEQLAAYGLARKGLGRVSSRINLMPTGQRKRPDRQVMYLVIGLLAVNIFLFMGWAGSLIIQSKLDNTRLDAEISKLSDRTRDLVVIDQQVREARTKIALLSDFQSGHPAAADLMLELSRILPSSAWLDTLTIKGGKIEISGRGESVADLVTLLEASDVFRNAAFLSTIIRGQDGKENFKIQMEIE